ncbi:CpeR homolog, phycoerythrin linker-proteins region [Crocosphaera watsonii WH 0402]|uniref:CpeR homolog, phycoerythrin linker-proteins region n=1 Tax=Crocosphaera watsonii WH 0402 TaxID=1284629 RepID=T2JQ38_CROWT|nr:CpeR homolog, phycoerythrin linker-proteins region [Crocosphaera watsonii WH 0402]
MGGTLISVDPKKRVWLGNHRQILLYQVKASLHTPHHELKQYWFKTVVFIPDFPKIPRIINGSLWIPGICC